MGQPMTTNSELFWRLFQTSGQIGLYLLYSTCQRRGDRTNTFDSERGDGILQGAESPDLTAENVTGKR